MENKKSILKYSLNQGVILGVVFILFSVILYVTGIDPMDEKWTGYINYIIMAFIFFYAQKEYRDKINRGYLSIGEGIKIGITIAVIGGTISAIYQLIFMTVIEPDYLEQALLKLEEQMLEQNPDMTESQIEMTLGISRKVMSPAFIVPMGIIGSAFAGLILSLLTSLFVKKSDSPL